MPLNAREVHDSIHGPRETVPMKGHSFHRKSNDQLGYIAQQAKEAAETLQAHDPRRAKKFQRQISDVATVLGYRQRGGAFRG